MFSMPLAPSHETARIGECEPRERVFYAVTMATFANEISTAFAPFRPDFSFEIRIAKYNARERHRTHPGFRKSDTFTVNTASLADAEQRFLRVSRCCGFTLGLFIESHIFPHSCAFGVDVCV